MTSFDLGILVGSFEPFCAFHQAAIEHALAIAPRVAVLIGSAGAARSLRHPWPADERIAMMREGLPADARSRIDFLPVRDRLYCEQQWLCNVEAATAGLCADAKRIAQLVPPGGAAEALLPGWHSVLLPPITRPDFWTVRRGVFGNAQARAALLPLLPESTRDFLSAFERSPHFDPLVEELHYIEQFRDSWRSAPYPPVFVTADAVVLHRGHILLVQRARAPGKGLWALPGGFVDQDETLLHAGVRELREETGLELTPFTMHAALRGQQTFDAPHRSLRGRTITHAACFVFETGELPALSAGDDAADARWFPLARFAEMEAQMFEDHFHIAAWFLNR